MKKINMYCGGYYEYGVGVVNELIDRGIIDFCLTECNPDAVTDRVRYSDKIVTYNPDYEVTCRYDKICDVNELPPVDKKIVECMLPFESMALKMGIRNTKVPVAEYEIEKRNYYIHLRYWYYTLRKYDINFIYLRDVPHSQAKYVIYGLAKILNIPVCICSSSSISGRYVHGTSISDLGCTIGEKYIEICDKQENVELSDPVIKEYFELHSKDVADIKKTMNPGRDSYTDFMRKHVQNAFQGEVIGIKGLMRYPYRATRTIVRSIVRFHSLDEYRKDKSSLRYLRRMMHAVRYYRMHDECTQKEYNRIAENPDYNNKYIYFALQLSPEATTLPSAGVFAEQYNSIQLLAKSAEHYGVMIYVKEHYVQPSRDIVFYEDLRGIRNVKLIKTKVETYELMSNSIAVATQTGTCILEGTLMNKPALVIGDGYKWKKMPGVFEISGYEDGCKAISEILSGITIDKELLRKYYCAIERECVLEPSKDEQRAFWFGGKDGRFKVDDKIISTKIELIERYINEYVV